MDSRSLFACLLIGQPTLRQRIKLGQFAALEQRIALRFAMPPMTTDETGNYIAHDAAPVIMRRGWHGAGCGRVSPQGFPHNQSCSRKAMRLSEGW